MRSSSVVYRLLYRFCAMLARLAVRSGRSKDASTCRHINLMRRPHQRVPKPSLTSHDRVSGTHTVANAYAERWIGTLRRELLDRTIIWNQQQLERLVVDYLDHYNTHRPHRSLNQRAPTAPEPATPLRQLDVARSTRCDGLIHEYQIAA
jgi:transposase InsO family protein